MIEYCLKKLPKDRPTAKVLATSQFIKKALNIKEQERREYIMSFIKDEQKDKPKPKVVRTRASKDAKGKWVFKEAIRAP